MRVLDFNKFFERRDWKPFQFQRQTWNAIENGADGLVYASTGMGKTYAVWLGLLQALRDPLSREDETIKSTCRVIWVSPLRALIRDTARSLQVAVEDAGIKWTIGVRTGDTPSRQKRSQIERLPDALITTPESLSILLSYPEIYRQLRGVRALVVDEWHELLGTKRGTQVELGRARVRRFARSLQTWGLSATVGNPRGALRRLLGDNSSGGLLIRGDSPNDIIIDAIVPPDADILPWGGHRGLAMVNDVVAEMEQGGTSLFFTNTRSQAEMWYRSILDARPSWAGEIAVHHGSLSTDTRAWVEEQLAEGSLRAVVCTSSLDLGVDFHSVERVFQLGSPKGVSRLLQRAGRSGHRPTMTSRATGVPTHALELLEYVAARRAAACGVLEKREGLREPLDVLIQHVVTSAIGSGFESDRLYEEIKTTEAYATLSQRTWKWVVDFAATGGGTLKEYDRYRRISQVDTSDGPRYVGTNERIARRHRMNIGTIVSDAELEVRFKNGSVVGTVEESFLRQLAPGDVFLFGGRQLELVRVDNMRVIVRLAKGGKPVVPRWMGGQLPLSTELAGAMRELLASVRAGEIEGAELQVLAPLVDLQRTWSIVPTSDELLIERTRTRDGNHVFVFPFEGRLVHEGLSAVVAHRLSKIAATTISVSFNDYGFELLSKDPIPIERGLRQGLLDVRGLEDDITSGLNAGEMARRQFREIARVAGLVFQGFPGQRRTLGDLQSSSSLIFDVFARFDPDNLLYKQAYREAQDRQLEKARLRAALKRMRRASVRVIDTPSITPLAFPIYVDRVSQAVSSEKVVDRVRRLRSEMRKAQSSR